MSRFVVEADGGSRGNPGPAAYGTVVRDAESGDGAARAGRAHRDGEQQRRGVPRADRRAGGGPRARPGRDGRGPAGLQARRRADVRPLEDQAPGHARCSRCGPATRCRRRRSPTRGCRASRTSTPTGWPTRRSTPPPAARRGRPPTARPSCAAQDAAAAQDAGPGRRRSAAGRAGTASSVRRRPRCCCATARRRTPRRSGSAGPAATDPELSDVGLRQAAAAAERLAAQRRRRRGRRLADAPDPADGRRGRRPRSVSTCARSTRSASARSASGRA